MSPERWGRLKELFGAALERSGVERAAWIRAACAGDEALGREIEELVSAHEAAGSFLEPVEPGARDGAGPEPIPTRLGPYRIVRELGHGGMGTVWLGERDDEAFRRRVAVKIVRRGMDHEAVVARFRNERQILAHLAHPNIATLIDGGTTAEGLPYFVMEYVEGEPIDVFCDARRLPVGQRIERFLQVCAAVAHAHARQVVHRDIKPGNVLITAEGVPKLLDFGLARLLDPGGASEQTTAAFRFLTPAFASPEQIAGAAVGPASDVWSLGALLYALLTGRRPRDARGEPGGREAGRLPTRPSEVALRAPGARGGPTPEALAALRGGTPEQLRERLAGDLDAILRKALDPYPARRYRSADELADDLRRHLAGRRTAARRSPRRRLVVAAAAAGLLLAGPAAWRRWGGAPAAPEGPAAVAVADLDNRTGDPEMEGLSSLLITSLEQSQRFSVLTRSRVGDLLRQLGRDPGQRVDEALGREIGRRSGVRALLVTTLRRLGDRYVIEMKALDPHADRYLFALREEARDKGSVPAAIDRLSARAREQLREERADVEAARTEVAEMTTASLEAYQHYFRGEQLQDDLRYQAAIEEYRRAVALDPRFALAHYQIAYVGKLHGLDPAVRREAIEAAVRHLERTPPKERLLIRAWHAQERGAEGEARALYARATERFPQDKQALYLAGDFHYHAGRWAEALPYFERAAALDPGWEPALMHLTDALFYLGRGRELLDQARAWVARKPGGQAYRALAWAEVTAGQREEAVVAARRALDIEGSGWNRGTLVAMLLHADRYPEAEELARGGLEAAVGSVQRAVATQGLVQALAYQGRMREALRALEALPAPVEGREFGVGRGRLLLLASGADAPAVRREALLLAGRASPSVAALALALGGDPVRAAREMERLPAGVDRAQAEAALAWRRGDRAQALRQLRELAAGSGLDGATITRWLLARVLLDEGRDAEAVAALEALRAAPGEIGSAAGFWRSWSYAQSLYLEAAARERLGDRAGARERIDLLLALWRRADPGLPLLAEARALRRRLAGP